MKLKTSIGAFDIILACSGYIYSLSVAKSLIQSNQAKNILLITSDTYSKFIKKETLTQEFYLAMVQLALLISTNKKMRGSFEIENFQCGTDGSGFKKCCYSKFWSEILE